VFRFAALQRFTAALAFVAIAGLAAPSQALADTWTDLRYAVYMGNTVEVARLLDAGADVNMQNDEGWTPLEVAAEQNNVTMVKFLLKRGANPAIADARRRRPVDVTNSAEVKRLLGYTAPAPARSQPQKAHASSTSAASSTGSANSHCKKMYAQTYKLCDASDYTCKIVAAQKYKECLKKGTWY